jgi:hypothetical protein
MEKGVVKFVVSNARISVIGKTKLSQGCTIWEIVQEVYVIPDSLNHTTQGELQRYENNYKALNLITTALGRNMYDRIAHLEMALLRLSLHIEIPITDSTRLFLKNMESP